MTSGTQDALPRWLRIVFIAVNDAPWTNIKSMNGEILTYWTAGFLGIAAMMQVKIDTVVLGLWLGFLAGKVGFAMAGAALKRSSFKPSPPATPDIEDVAATTATPAPEKK